MAYQEEEKAKLRRQSSREAITLAMQGQWREAITVNQNLVELFPNDVEAYNRLGRAYMELSEYAEAENAYKHTIQIDPYNAIAQKNVQRLSLLKKTHGQTATRKVNPQQFIEEIGKAGVVQLHNLAPAVVLAKVVAADVVNLKVEGTFLSVESTTGDYLGHVEPKHGQRLIRLMQGGNKYSAAIVSSGPDALSVIIRETYKDPSQSGQPSFPTRGVEGPRTEIGDRVIRRELEQEEALLGEPGFSVVGGEEHEVLAEEPMEDEYDDESEG